jgi:hypothetical protein
MVEWIIVALLVVGILSLRAVVLESGIRRSESQVQTAILQEISGRLEAIDNNLSELVTNTSELVTSTKEVDKQLGDLLFQIENR